ncbi:hypothetical protein SLE2022_125540 [Rubroshorea leprosula]
MELQTPNNDDRNSNPHPCTPQMETHHPHDDGHGEAQCFNGDIDSSCSTPYVSAPSSPGRVPGSVGFFYSAPASPMHFAITSAAASMASATRPPSPDNSVPLGYEFEFSARFGSSGSGQTGSMISADELFFNGQIRPMKLSNHLERAQILAPLMDLGREEEEIGEESESGDGEKKSRGRDLRLRDKSLRRRTRSMSPSRTADVVKADQIPFSGEKNDEKNEEMMFNETNASMSASSSRSSSAGRSSKRWVFLKDFLRSKSEGRSNNKFWSTISFSPTKEKKLGGNQTVSPAGPVQDSKERKGSSGSENQRERKPVNGVGKRRVARSPHELHYTTNRAHAEEMRKKTYLPYRHGLFGCLGFSSKGYGAMNGLARALNPVSSR